MGMLWVNPLGDTLTVRCLIKSHYLMQVNNLGALGGGSGEGGGAGGGSSGCQTLDAKL